MAPEVITMCVAGKKEEQNSPTDLKGPDIWAVGCTFLEMCTGCKPWKDDDPLRLMFKLASEPNLLPDFPQDESPEFTDLLSKTVESDPTKRINIDQLVDHLFFSTSFERSAQPVDAE